MDFNFSPEQEQIRETVRRFCRDEIAPLAREADETETFPRELFPKWAELGLLGVRYPEADGADPSRHLADLEGRYRGTETALFPARADRRQDCRLRSQRARWRLQHPGDEDAGR